MIDEPQGLDQLPVALREPRKIAPRATFSIFVPGRDEVAYVDRATGEAHVVGFRGGRPRRVSPERSTSDSPPGSPGEAIAPYQSGTSGESGPVVIVAPGPGEGEIIYRVGDKPYRVSTGKGAASAVQVEGPAEEEARKQEVFRPLLLAHHVPPGAYVLRVSDQRAVVVVTEQSALPRGLYAVDAAAQTLRPALPPGLGFQWAPQSVGDDQVVFGGSDGRYYLLDVATLQLSCASAPMPQGFRPGPPAMTADRAWLAYAAQRDIPLGWEVIIGLVDLKSGTDRRLGRLTGVTGIPINPIPRQSRFVVTPRLGDSGVLFMLDGARGLVRLTPPIVGLGQSDVSEKGVVFTREKPTTVLVETPPPPRVQRDPRMGCDPVMAPTGGCGWVSNGCDYVYVGPCVRQIAEPDPLDGIYAIDW